jgi:hypothetical protein
MVLMFKLFFLANEREFFIDDDIYEHVFFFFNMFFNEDNLRTQFYHLSFYLSRIMPFFFFSVTPLIINNDQVTAVFIARFFAIKLSTGHSVKFLVKNVGRDLRYSAVDLFIPHVLSPRYNNILMSNNINYKVIVMKVYILKSLFVFKRLFLKFYFYNKSWFNLYTLWFNV